MDIYLKMVFVSSCTQCTIHIYIYMYTYFKWFLYLPARAVLEVKCRYAFQS